MNKNLKIIAMYFTQLHAIPENDKWWGKGFTDWKNVKKAEPLLDTHYQPRVPSNSDYYDQSRLQTLRKQVELAKKYGIYGFCHYHYWFDGKQLLETPTNLLLENSENRFSFLFVVDKLNMVATLRYWRSSNKRKLERLFLSFAGNMGLAVPHFTNGDRNTAEWMLP